MANIKDVAKLAEVGIGTVSRVLNNSGYVKKSTRERVERAVLELGYFPNEIARNMTHQLTNIVAFILPNSRLAFFSDLIFYVEKSLYEHGYKLMVCNSGANRQKEIDYISMLKRNQVDGIIFLTSNDIEKEIDSSLPMVSFDRHFDHIPLVACDNYFGGQMAAQKLLTRHPHKLLFIGDNAQGEHTSIETEVTKRRKGFVDYLDTYGFSNYVIVEYPLGDSTIPKEYIHQIVEQHQDVDGIFAISDSVASVVLRELINLGKRIPEDVAVIGFDGINSNLNIGKQLTSISQPTALIGEALVTSLIHKFRGESTKSIILPVGFVPGETL